MGLFLYLAMLLLFASWMTCHALLCLALSAHDLGRALVSFFIFPLAPFYGRRAGLSKLPVCWLATFVLYGLAFATSLAL